MILQLQKSIVLLLIVTLSLLHACPIGEVVTSTAQVTYKMDNKGQILFSNEVNFIKTKHTDAYQLEFFRYTALGDTYLNISHTTYSTDGEAVGTFNPMKPLTLSTGEVLKPSSKISLLATEIFSKYDPIIIVLKDQRANISETKSESVKVSIDNDRGDIEIIELFESAPKSGMFVGYINPTVDKNKAKECDGFIYAYDNAKITAKPIVSSYKSRGVSSVKLQKSLTIAPSLSSLSSIESKNQKKVWISHKSTKTELSLGDFIKLDVEIGNLQNVDTKDFDALIKLPKGLTYKKGSIKIQNEAMEFKEDLLEENILHLEVKQLGGELIKCSYIATVSSIPKELAIDAWCLEKDVLISNLTKHTLSYKKEFLANKGFIFGELDGEKNTPLKDIRVYTGDGRYVLTDKNGKFHFEGLSKELHVIQIDTESIDARYQIKGEKTKFADLSYGGVKRVKFHLEKRAKKSQASAKKQKRDQAKFTKKAKKSPKMPAYGVKDLKNSADTSKFLWPPEGFNPSMPSIKVALLYKRGQKLKLYLNDKETNPLNFDKTVASKDAKMQIATYRGLDLKRGDNFLEAQLFSKKGKLVKSIKRKVHFSTSAVRAEVLGKASYLVADGKNPVVIAVKFYDKQGFPVAEDSRGMVNVEMPYQLQSRLDGLKINPLSNSAQNNYYAVYGEGIAYITLAPTTKSGEAVMHFNFENRDTVLRTWIRPQNREWIVVGFAEGTLGYQKIEQNMEEEKSKDDTYHKGKVSLFAKGKVKGDVLLTVAYNSGKPKDSPLLDKVDPNAYYMVYQDDAIQDHEAQSQKKLYLKIEKEQFYALFGDYDTGLEVNELSRYRRVLNGIKSEYNSEKFAYKAFLSESKNIFVKDEIKADGSSGLYYLKNKNILRQSEKVVIEVRDRYREEKIISAKTLHRFADYSIDYNAGTLYFKAPLFSTDESGNPRYIAVDYEIASNGSKNLLYGGRAAAKFNEEKIEVGTTYIKEDLGKNSKSLQGIDTKIRFNDQLGLNAEYAQTDHTINEQSVKGDAYLIELLFQGKLLKTTAYFRNQNNAFGLDQQSKLLRQSQKIGIDGRFDYFKNIAILFSAYSDKDLIHKSQSDAAEVMVELHNSYIKSALGYRHSRDKSVANNQLIVSAEKMLLDNKLKAGIRHEHSLDTPTTAYPTRTQLELRYALKSYTDLFVRSELSQFDKSKVMNNSVGLSSRLWQGGEIESAITDGYENDTKNLYSRHGISQNYQYDKHITLSGGIEQKVTIKGKENNSSEDFVAYSGAINYNKKPWVSNLKAEYRDGKKEDKLNLDFGVYNQISDDVGLTCGIRYNKTANETQSQKRIETNFSGVYRPKERWIILNRFDIVHLSGSTEESDRFISNLLLNYQVADDLELSLQFGLKYIQEKIDQEVYESVINILGIHTVLQLSSLYDLGFHASTLYNHSTDQSTYMYGTEVGYTLLKNSWLGIGYNFRGYYDEDFSLQNYTTQGAYIKIRVKFDKENLRSILDHSF